MKETKTESATQSQCECHCGCSRQNASVTNGTYYCDPCGSGYHRR